MKRGRCNGYEKCCSPGVEVPHEMEPAAKQFKASPREGRAAQQNSPGDKKEGKFKCPFCTKRYRFRQSLKVRTCDFSMQSKALNQINKFLSLAQCSLPLFSQDHMNKHTGRRPHVCKYCSSTFMHFGRCVAPWVVSEGLGCLRILGVMHWSDYVGPTSNIPNKQPLLRNSCPITSLGSKQLKPWCFVEICPGKLAKFKWGAALQFNLWAQSEGAPSQPL